MSGKHHPTRIPDVSTLTCPEAPYTQLDDNGRPGPGPHRIENRGAQSPACRWCGVTWADLDDQLRASLPNRGREPV